MTESRSEPHKWTPEGISGLNVHQLRVALTAECENIRLRSEKMQALTSDNVNLQNQLTAERQRREQAEEQLKIQDTSVRLQERTLKFFRDKRDLGDASRLDLNLVNLEYTQALLQREAATNERDRARHRDRCRARYQQSGNRRGKRPKAVVFGRWSEPEQPRGIDWGGIRQTIAAFRAESRQKSVREGV